MDQESTWLRSSSEDRFYLPRWGRPDFADVKICCVDGSVMAHRVILAIHSPLLKLVLLEREGDDTPVLTFAEHKLEEVNVFLDILYGQSPMEPEQSQQHLAQMDLFHVLKCVPIQVQNEVRRVKREVIDTELEAQLFGIETGSKSLKMENGNGNKVRASSKMDIDGFEYIEPMLTIKESLNNEDEIDDENDLDFKDSDFGVLRKQRKGRKRKFRDKEDSQDYGKMASPDLMDDQMEEDDDIYNCDECGKSFKNEMKLVDHKIKGHKERKPRRRNIQCEKCSKVCPTEGSYQKHIKKCGSKGGYADRIKYSCVLNPEDPLSCPQKDCKFKSDTELKIRRHYRQVHEMRMCSYCGELILFYQLKAHIAEQHTKDFQYKCDYCAEGFVTQRKLDEHREKVHIRLPTYICDLCGKGLVSKRLLSNHRFEAHYFETHDPKCPHCKMVFKDRKRLSRHKKMCGSLHADVAVAAAAAAAAAAGVPPGVTV